MKRKMNKTCKWLALGATLALGSAFVVPAVFNESPVAIEETVNAETTYQSVDGVSIVSSINHVTSAGIGWNRNLLLQFQSSSTTVTMDKTTEQGNFFTNATININGTVTSLKDSKFGFSSYEVVNHGVTYYNMIYAPNNTWEDPADGEMYTMTIPTGTIVYDCQFSQDVELYFFEGIWRIEKPSIPQSYQSVDGVKTVAAYNHITSAGIGWHRNLLLQITNGGTTVSMDKTVSQGNFFTKATIDINGTVTSLKDSKFGFSSYEAVNHGAVYYNMIYAPNNTWEDPVDGQMYTMTIPEGTIVYDCKFSAEVKLYFYEGAWTLVRPVLESEKVYTSPNQLQIDAGFCGIDWAGAPNTKNLIFYAWYETNKGVPHNFAYGQGTFNKNTTLIEYTNGVQTAVYEDKVYFTQSAHVTDGGTVIHLQYATDNDFWAKTTDKYYKFNIPAGTTLYATKFETEMNLYYVNGNWTTVAPDEVASVYGASLSLTGNIGVNFYVNIPAATLNDADAYVQIKHGETTKEIPVSEGVETNGYYVFSYQVTSAQTADDIALTVFRNVTMTSGHKADVASVTLHYSVEKYAEDYARYCQENPDSVDEKLTALVNAMVAYGDYANAYFNDGDALADIESVTAADFEGVAATQKGESANVSDITASLVMGSETSIKVYFKYTGEGAPVCKVAGEEVTAVYDEEKGMYYIAKRNINAANLDITYTFEIDGFIFTYSAYVYFKDVIETSADTELVNLVKAAYLYSLAAETYFVA